MQLPEDVSGKSPLLDAGNGACHRQTLPTDGRTTVLVHGEIEVKVSPVYGIWRKLASFLQQHVNTLLNDVMFISTANQKGSNDF